GSGWAAVRGGERMRSGWRRAQRREIASLRDLLVADDAAGPHRVELLAVVRQPGASGPLRLKRAGGSHRIPLALGHDSQEALDPHDARAADPGDGRLVHGNEGGAERAWTDH